MSDLTDRGILDLSVRAAGYLRDSDKNIGETQSHMEFPQGFPYGCWDSWEAYERPSTGERFRIHKRVTVEL